MCSSTKYTLVDSPAMQVTCWSHDKTGSVTHGGRVDEDGNDYHQQEDDDAPNDVPLVVAPDDVLEGLPG